MISLPSRTDRRDSSLLAAVYTGLEIEFVDAVDGDKYNEKTFPPGGKFENFNKVCPRTTTRVLLTDNTNHSSRGK